MSTPTIRPASADQYTKHVIAEYKHRDLTVTCVCGWHGSTATNGSKPSEWSAHIAENRGKRP